MNALGIKQVAEKVSVRVNSIDEPLISTTSVCERLGLTVSVQVLKDCGFSPVVTYHRASYWSLNDFPAMCQAIAKMVLSATSQG